MPLINHCNGGASFAAIIQVAYTKGATCTCSNGSTTYTAPDTTGSCSFKVRQKGTWTVTVTLSGDTASESVTIANDMEVKTVSLMVRQIYGISRDITASSPEWTRTDNAVGMTATASKGTVAGSSDFDKAYPWGDITRVTASTGDVMVRIPKFWYRRYREGNIEHIEIANKATDNFSLHPAFNHNDVQKDYVYIGAYMSYDAYPSSGYPMSQTAKVARSYSSPSNILPNLHNKGDGWNAMSISALSAIQMLILVEFATNDVQTAIGRGLADSTNTNDHVSGSCDAVPGLTGIPAGTDGETGVVWRGIENLWGDYWQLIELACWRYTTSTESTSLQWKGLHISNNARTDTTDFESKLSFTCNREWQSAYVTKLGFDSNYPYVLLPEEASGGSSSTFMCDAVDGLPSTSSTTYYFTFGGYSNGSESGLFCYAPLQYATSASDTALRLMFIPQEEVV